MVTITNRDGPRLAVVRDEEAANRESAAWRGGEDTAKFAGLHSREQLVIEIVVEEIVRGIATNCVVVHQLGVEAIALEEERKAVGTIVRTREQNQNLARRSRGVAYPTGRQIEGLGDGGDSLARRRGRVSDNGRQARRRGIGRRGQGSNWPDPLIADLAPWHERLVEVDVAGVDDFPASRDPHSVAAGHVGTEAEVDAGDAVRV